MGIKTPFGDDMKYKVQPLKLKTIADDKVLKTAKKIVKDGGVKKSTTVKKGKAK